MASPLSDEARWVALRTYATLASTYLARAAMRDLPPRESARILKETIDRAAYEAGHVARGFDHFFGGQTIDTTATEADPRPVDSRGERHGGVWANGVPDENYKAPPTAEEKSNGEASA